VVPRSTLTVAVANASRSIGLLGAVYITAAFWAILDALSTELLAVVDHMLRRRASGQPTGRCAAG
jgi:hypothetical protein